MFKNIFCEICSSEIVKQVSRFPFKSKLLGDIAVPNVEQFVCVGCGKSFLSLAEGKKISSYVKEKEKRAVESQPFNAFVSLNEAAEILEVSKQAFSKNARIKKGLICSAVIDGKTLYLRNSVEEFKRTRKDGRVKLNLPKGEVVFREVTKYVTVPPRVELIGSNYIGNASTLTNESPYIDCEEFNSQYNQHCLVLR
jgi:YgiT-type zinc finger domain-containing protein